MKRILMGIALVPCMAFATTWYVDGTNGTDGNSGTSPAEAKATIQAAIDAANNDDTIIVSEGIYGAIAVEKNRGLIIKSASGASATIIDGNDSATAVVLSAKEMQGDVRKSMVVGFTLQHGYGIGQYSCGGIWGGIASNCIVRSNFASGFGGGSASYGCELYGCLITENALESNAGGILCNSYLYNCTVCKNNAAYGLWDCDAHNTISYNSGSEYLSYGKREFFNSLLSKAWYPEHGNITGDPHFVDAANGDYRLASDSPCIDAGDNSYVAGDTDLDGSERIVNGKVDIGCYEYGSVGGPYVEKIGETNWTYMIKNGKASIGDGVSVAVDKAIAGAVDVPTTLRTRPVVAIDNNALKDCTNMTSVTIPASVKTIGASAFEGCDKLADVYFEGETMSAIGVDAFRGCHWDLIMHVPADWQGRGRTLCGYSVWRAGSSDEEKSVSLTTTNVVVQYVLNSVQPEIAVPVSGDTGFVAVITEVTSSGAVSVPIEWKANYPQYEAKFGTDFGKSLMAKSGKRDCANNEMLVWQDYVAGTDPTDENSKFTASITMVEGVPVISYSPELTAEQTALRTYKTFGKKQLGDTEWTNLTDASGETLKAYNFFKVTVEMK